MSDIFGSLEILAIKSWFRFNFEKILQSHHLVVGGPKNFKEKKLY